MVLEFNDRPVISSVWIFMAILFYPVSIVLIIIRIIMHRNLSYQRVGDIKVGGYSLLGFFGMLSLIIILATWGQNTWQEFAIVFILLGVIFLIPAGYLLWLGKQKLRQLDDRYDKYHNIILEQRETSLVVIAQITRRHPKMIENDVLRMMYLGLLEEGYIDESSNRIVFTKRANSDDADYEVYEEIANGNQVKLFPKKVECAGCGSSSTLKPRETSSCSYCGASMVYPA